VKDLVVMVPGNPWDGNRLGQHHLAVHLAQRAPVLWVDPQISYLTPLNDAGAARTLREDRLREVAPNIMRLSPITVPGVTRPVLRDVALRQARRAVRRAVAALGGRVHSTIVASLHDMLDVVPAAQSVFYGTDDYVAGARLTGTDPRWLERVERRQLDKADVVIAISPVLRDKWGASRPDVHLVPNGCNAEHLAVVDEAPLPPDVDLPGPIAGFVGHLSDRIDVELLAAVAATGVSLLLVGPQSRTSELAQLDELLALPNVRWVGPKPFSELPSYLRLIDVGLTPYRQSAFNAASFPLKTLEYLAAGRPAVVSDLPAHRWLDTPYVTIAASPEEFAARTRALAASPGDASAAAARRAFAARHSWSARAADVARLLQLDSTRTDTAEPARAA
jgi:teichuronic acid biosynthesis glycosyltransferase TuaH